jgi:hypothetical protein
VTKIPQLTRDTGLRRQFRRLQDKLEDTITDVAALNTTMSSVLSNIAILVARPLRGTLVHDIGTLQSSGTFTISHASILSSHRLWVMEMGSTGAPLNLRVQSIADGEAVIGWTGTLQSGIRTFWWVAH